MQVDKKSILFHAESKRLPKDTLLISVVSQKIKLHNGLFQIMVPPHLKV